MTDKDALAPLQIGKIYIGLDGGKREITDITAEDGETYVEFEDPGILTYIPFTTKYAEFVDWAASIEERPSFESYAEQVARENPGRPVFIVDACNGGKVTLVGASKDEGTTP